MSRRLSAVAIIAAVVLLAAGPIVAGPLQMEQISAKAKWLVHGDVKAFLASKTGTFVLAEMRKKGLDAALNNVHEVFGFDVTKDLKSFTVYGSRFGDRAAVILTRATLDRQRITDILRGNETYREMKYGGHVVHQWTDNPHAETPGATKFGVFHGDDLAVMTEDLRLLQEAIDVLDKKAASMASGMAKSLPSPAAAGKAFLTAFVAKLPSLGEGKPEAVVLGKIASGHVTAGESNDRVRVHVEAMAKTAKTAANLRKIADGILAFLDLASAEQLPAGPAGPADQVLLGDTPLPGELIAVLKAVTVTAKDRTVKLDANVPVKDVTALIGRLINQQKPSTPPPATSAEK